MNDENKELVWVDEKLAIEYKKLNDDKSRKKMFNDYIETIRESSRNEFKANMDNLEEDVIIYKGLMLNVKQAFQLAKNEQLNASYEMWEKFEKEMPNIKEKTQKIIDVLYPLVQKLTEVNTLMSKVQIYNFEKMLETVDRFNQMSDDSKEMVKFLFNNYKEKNEDKL